MIVSLRIWANNNSGYYLIHLQFNLEKIKKQNPTVFNSFMENICHLSHISETNLTCLSWLNSCRDWMYTIEKRMTLDLQSSNHFLVSLDSVWKVYISMWLWARSDRQSSQPKGLSLEQMMDTPCFSKYLTFIVFAWLNCLPWIPCYPSYSPRNG
jgi:hypothetical protein